MKFIFSIALLFAIFTASAQVPDSNYVRLYKASKIIFTGVLKSKYQLPALQECEEGPRMLLEYELTEIQKGPRRYKVMIESNDSTQKINHEYLVFSNRVKTGNEKKNISLHTEEVCMNCPNPGIKNVYRIVYIGLFRTIKPPLTPGNMAPIGCGCH